MNKNIDLVANIFDVLKQMNVADIIVCAGARNLPLVEALEYTEFNIESYFEERSAGFYALGKIKSSKKPVAVVTTSGTAVAEILPAVIEAYYQNLDLIVVSADRPKNYRGSGSPQSINHIGIFSVYANTAIDWDYLTTEFKIISTKNKPLHLNVCFQEPLIDGKLCEAKKTTVTVTVQHEKPKIASGLKIVNPIAIISEIDFLDRKMVKDFLLKNKIIHYAEFLSGLKNDAQLLSLQIQSSDSFVKNIFKNKQASTLLRIGGVPTLRFWRDLESDYKDLPVISFSSRLFTGLARESKIFDLQSINQVEVHVDNVVDNQIVLSFDIELQNKKINLLNEHKNSEQNFVNKIANYIYPHAVYVGNSLPIRTWDGIVSINQNNQDAYANRGANGIDGQISTYLGWAQNKPEAWCVVGDLTALYDLSALGLAVGSTNKKRIVIINNCGGQIFSRILGNQKYLNAQKVDFKSWAQMWLWDYILIQSVDQMQDLKNISGQQLIIELRPDNLQTESFWKQWDLLCKK